MKNLIFTMLFAGSMAITATAQQPGINWIVSAGGTGIESLQAVCTAPGNALVAVGTFSGSCTIGATTITSVASGTDVFIAKYASGNTVDWVKSFGNACNEQVKGVATDSKGNIFVTGSFYSTLSIENHTVYSAGSKDLFLASFDPNGNLNWLNAFGGSGSDEGVSVKIDAAGNVYLAAIMDQAGFAVADQPSLGVSAHVARFDSEGVLLWSACESGTAQGYITIQDMTVDANGKVFVTGSYFGQVLAGNGGTIAMQSSSEKLWAAGYDENGSSQFIFTLPQQAGSTNGGTAIALTGAGNLLVAAYHSGTVTMSGITYQSPDRDVMILSLDFNGALLWGNVMVTPGFQSPESIIASPNGTYAVGGYFLDNFNASGTLLINQGGTDGFVLLADQGLVTGAISFSSIGNDLVHDIIDFGSGIIATGNFSGGTTTVMNAGSSTISSMGDQDCFMASLSGSSSPLFVDEHTDQAIETFPNPAKDQVHIRYNASSEKVFIELYAFNGQRVLDRAVTKDFTNEIILDISALAPGAYTVLVHDGNAIGSSTIVVE